MLRLSELVGAAFRWLSRQRSRHQPYLRRQKTYTHTQWWPISCEMNIPALGICCKLIIGDGLYGYVCQLSIHNSEAGASCLPHCFGIHNVMVDGKVANIAIYNPSPMINLQHLPIPNEVRYINFPRNRSPLGMGICFLQMNTSS